MAERDTPGWVPPRTVTPRDKSAATYGLQVATIAAAMGWPLLPWQKYVADVAGELNEDGTFRYHTVIVTVQRQAGKTTLDVAESIHNCLLGPNRRAWYTAQTGQHASYKWREMVDDYFAKSPLAQLATANYSNGAQSLKFFNGSTLSPHPPNENSLHSKQSDKNTIDEFWSFSQLEADALLGAITPTTTTREILTGHRPQLWIMSTEGHAGSEALNALLKKHREVEIPGVALFDWGIPSDTLLPDMEDEAQVEAFLDVVWAHHPGAGHLFKRSALRNWLDQLGLHEFARAYGNRRTGAISRVIPEAAWRAAATVLPIPDEAPVVFGAASGMDGFETTITATAYLDDGRKVTEVIDHQPGVDWAVPKLKELTLKFNTFAVIDKFGPSSDLADQAEREGIALIPIQLREIASAAQALFNGVTPRDEFGMLTAPKWLHRTTELSSVLDKAADVAAKRSVSDGAWTWGRRSSSGNIAPLEAATLSSWGIDHMPERHGMQLF